jgi:hypothetical protein
MHSRICTLSTHMSVRCKHGPDNVFTVKYKLTNEVCPTEWFRVQHAKANVGNQVANLQVRFFNDADQVSLSFSSF